MAEQEATALVSKHLPLGHNAQKMNLSLHAQKKQQQQKTCRSSIF